MFCEKCGNNIPDEAKFCPVCGSVTAKEAAPAASVPVEAPAAEVVSTPVEAAAAPVEAAPVEAMPAPVEAVAAPSPASIPVMPPQMAAAPVFAAPAAAPAAPAKKPSGKMIGIIAGCAAALLLIVLLLALLGGGASGGNFVACQSGYAYYSNDDVVYVFYNDTLLEEIDVDIDKDRYYDSLVYSSFHNSERTICAIRMVDGALYYFDKGRMTQVAKKLVTSSWLSSDGSALYYATTDDDEHMLYVFKDGKSTEITELDFPKEDDYYFYEYYIRGSVSPDGGAFMYSQYDKNGEYTMYGWNGGEPIKLKGDLRPVCVSNGGKTAYLANDDNELVVYKNFTEKIATIKDYDSLISRSADNSEILFRNDDSKTYVYNTSMDSPIKVNNDSLELIYPNNAVLCIKNFDSFIAVNDNDDICRYTRKGKEYIEIKIAKDHYGYQLSADGKKLLYRNDDYELYIVSTTSKEPKATQICDECSSFTANPDLKHIYYFDDENTYYSKGKEDDSKEIYDEYIHSTAVLNNGTIVFYDNRNELYYSANGSEAKQSHDLDEADSITMLGGKYLVIRLDDEVYTSTDGIKYTLTDVDLD